VVGRDFRIRLLWYAQPNAACSTRRRVISCRDTIGYIFRAVHVHTAKVVAIKVQRANHECPTNRYERGFYPALQGGEGIPTLWASGVEGQWDYLAIDLLGPSLENIYRKSGKDTMDLGSVCCIAMQVVSVVSCTCLPTSLPFPRCSLDNFYACS